MQTVGAQWLLVDPPNAPALVSLVPVSNALPLMLWALRWSWPSKLAPCARTLRKYMIVAIELAF
jgi:hypothetical protein